MNKLPDNHPLITLRQDLIQEIVDKVRCHSGKWKHSDKKRIKHLGKCYNIVKQAIKDFESI